MYHTQDGSFICWVITRLLSGRRPWLVLAHEFDALQGPIPCFILTTNKTKSDKFLGQNHSGENFCISLRKRHHFLSCGPSPPLVSYTQLIIRRVFRQRSHEHESGCISSTPLLQKLRPRRASSCVNPGHIPKASNGLLQLGHTVPTGVPKPMPASSNWISIFRFWNSYMVPPIKARLDPRHLPAPRTCRVL